MPLVRNPSGVVHEVPEGHWALTSGGFTIVHPDPTPEPTQGGDAGLEALTVRELRDLADERGIQHAGLKKAELVRALS